MTDPQTPATEARATLRHAAIYWKQADQPDKPLAVVERWADWLLDAIEAEARAADYVTGHRHGVAVGRADAWTDAKAEAEATIVERLTRVYETARADALREASNSVADLEQRALGGVLWVRYQRVLAILDPETDGHALNPDHIEARGILDPETTP